MENNKIFLNNYILYNGGYMRRLFRISFLSVMFCVLGLSVGRAADKPEVLVGGRVASDEVRVFTKDSVYKIYNRYVIAGTLIIEPGTLVKFAPNGRLIDSTGGRIIADGSASAIYNMHPEDQLNPGTYLNPIKGQNGTNGWVNYGSMGYFLYPNTIVKSTATEKTVNRAKADYVFNVVLDTATRVMRSAQNNLDYDGIHHGFVNLGPTEVVIPFEKAIMFANSGIAAWNDNDLAYTPWERADFDLSINIAPEKIKFVGQATNNFTREKGHIVIMPGARAAFFRNCSFENMRKDTTVDYTDYYANNPTLNANMIKLTNGKGGAITTFSSRTWLLDCEFKNNLARNAAGALQVLQAPEGLPLNNKINTLGYYPADKNPALTEPNGNPSLYNLDTYTRNTLRRIDNLDESFEYELLTDEERQAYDDARLSIYLGRMRNLKFENNSAKLSGVKLAYVGSFLVEVDDETAGATKYPQKYGNYAKGGAILIAGRDNANNTTKENQIEVALGVNNKINIKTATGFETLEHATKDAVVFNNNTAKNYQGDMNSLGSMGGAIYLGANTSLIVSGNFNVNSAATPFFKDGGMTAGNYAKGGAIYQEEGSFGRLQVRGDETNAMKFEKNTAYKGGALYVAASIDATVMSPVIGGADNTPTTRNYGKELSFVENTSRTLGGAIYTERNMRINGAGGLQGTTLNYSDGYRVAFDKNLAAFGGGAVAINLPDNNVLKSAAKSNLRNIFMARAIFTKNKVGTDAIVENGTDITAAYQENIIGGGAIFSKYADLNVIKGVEFTENKVMNGNGAAIHIGAPSPFSKKFFVSDLDVINYNTADYSANDIPVSVTSTDAPFTTGTADVRMLTRFINNNVDANLADQNGTGMTQIQSGTLITRKNINAITFLDDNNGFAVGDQGTIIKLSQAGDVWEYQNYPATNNLTSIYFTTDRIGFIGGDQGLILKTIDAGATWNVVNPSGNAANINAISFINSMNGVAVANAGKVFATNDGGDSWTEIQTVTANKLNDVAFAGINKGLAVGDRGTILITEDGGTTWNALNNSYLRMYNLESIYFTDATTGYIAGNGVVLKTINSGSTWTVSHTANNKNYTKVVFTGLNTGYAYDADGTLVKTIDAGANWTEEKVYINDSTVALASRVNDVYYLNQNTALIASQRGMMFRTVNNGGMWNRILAADSAREAITRFHPTLGIAENGIGLGGAIYIVDSASVRDGSTDEFRFNRVRFEKNTAFSGAAIYSDNYNLKLALTRSLAVGNKATSQIGMTQNAITGPAFDQDTNFVIDVDGNQASSDLAGAIFYGEIVGPLPYAKYSYAANSIYGNDARFLIRLPDAPNTKGALAGRRPGPSGVDTLQGNYWGKTEANVTLFVNNNKDAGYDYDKIHTFFVDKCDKNYLTYVFGKEGSVDTLQQGPFENNCFYSTSATNELKTRFEYAAVALRNITASQDTADANTIPEKFLMSGRIYDLYDKGTDIKVADYSNRRMSPIEDFAVGIPPYLKNNINDKADKYIIRWTRDPFVAEDPNYPMIAALQAQWAADPDSVANETKGYYHPIGWPLFLEAKADYYPAPTAAHADANINNNDTLMVNESVFFVINETTTDFIRVSAKQLDNVSETLRARVEFTPDLATRKDNGDERRMFENLLDLPQQHMLNILTMISNPENEDAAALQGRKYYGPNTMMGGNPPVADLFVNRDHFAPSNGANHNATFFAGERYTALPVNVGDIVSVVSRTVLHREGAQKAIDGAIRFKITRSTKAPIFTGDVVKMQTQSTEPIFNNTVYVTEDRMYPCPNPSDLYSNMGDAAGRDSIITVTGIDYNKFYDPRSTTDSLEDRYSSLYYRMVVDNNTAASKWLKTTTLAATQGTKDGAAGYMVLRGTPMNPYIVPGGETVKVRIENFAPSVRTQDSLDIAFFGKNDTLSKFMYIYPSYFNAPVYDMTIEANTDNKPLRARYLQQDTIFNTANYFTEYEFKLFVVDSTPRFIANLDYNGRTQPELYYQDKHYVPTEAVPQYQDSTKVRVIYVPTKFRNGLAEMTNDGKLIANLTDKLRLQADFNTDDEAEDYWAGKYGWDFKYGKTAYGFNNVAMRGDDRIVVDIPNQTRPSWMSNNNIYKYNSDTEADAEVNEFTKEGKLNIRIDGTVARQHLGLNNTYAKATTLDTVFTVVANDGHSGMTVMPVDVYVNVAPQILNTTLVDATEGIDYNPTLTDTTKMIKIYDPNQDQEHRYELLYANDPRLNLAKDPAFPEAGFHNLVGKATTPEWLKINPMTGMLYGKPSVENVTEEDNRLDTVTVIVWDKVRQAYFRTDFKSLKSNGTNFFAVGENGAVVKIDPATSVWSNVVVPSEVSTFDFNEITFADAQNGYIVGNHGVVLKTTDGGTTWTNVLVDNYKHFNFTTVEFADANNGLIAGEFGNMFKTTDGGTTWTKVANAEMTSTINKVKMFDANTFVAATTQGNCFISANAGATISKVELPAGAGAIVDMYEVSDSKLLAITNNSIYTSADKGATWTLTEDFDGGLGAFELTSIGNFESDNAELNSTKAQVVFVTASSPNYTVVMKSVDGGANFGAYQVDDRFEQPYNKINDLVMYRPNIGYMIGDDGSIVRFTTKDTLISIAQVGAREYDMLSDVKVITLKVNAISHKPEVTTVVRPECIQKGTQEFIDELFISDKDLLRPNSTEEITIAVVSPTNGNWTVTPTKVTKANLNDKNKVRVQLKYKYVSPDVLDANGRLNVQLSVTDKDGNVVLVPFSYKYSDNPDFISTIIVSNDKGSSQILEWGTAEWSAASTVSTGDGNDYDVDPNSFVGKLDSNYCEYEIPPVPTTMVFDARWSIPTRTGTLRNIQPRSSAGDVPCYKFVYKATFQSGGNDPSSSTGDFVPLKITWNPKEIPAEDNKDINKAGASFFMQDANSLGNLFIVNMANPKKARKMGDVKFIANDDTTSFTVQLAQLSTRGFNIVYTCQDLLATGDVNDSQILTGIQSVGPNPVENASKVTFGTSEYGNVRIELYDAIGNLVNTIANSDFAAGVHTVDFDAVNFAGNKLATGSYTIRMIAGTEVSTYQVKVVR